ncbi:MAG: cupredoxin domain-containing protein [Candidatus Uhrbacteria bacterium]|nr:cupredoxin domain-containing protein [Candidatus Uhrbacteria bacterium]
MKKIIVALSLLALVGAGCAKTPVASKTDTNPQTSVVTVGADGKASVTPIDSTNKKDKKTVSGRPSVEAPTSGNDVPVTDIFLGQAQEKYDMEVSNFSFKPNVLNVKAGDAVQITFTKAEGTHTFVIDETDTHNTVTQGSNLTFIAPTKPGSYKFYCNVGNHRAMGMEGTINVK